VGNAPVYRDSSTDFAVGDQIITTNLTSDIGNYIVTNSAAYNSTGTTGNLISDMNTKQTILIFITFFIMILGLSIPLWLDKGLPILKDYLNTTIDTLEKGYAFLKFITGHIADIFVRIYEKFVPGAD